MIIKDKIKKIVFKIRKDIVKGLKFLGTCKALDAAEEKGLESVIISAAASKGITLTSDQVKPYSQGIVDAFDKLDLFLASKIEVKAE